MKAFNAMTSRIALFVVAVLLVLAGIYFARESRLNEDQGVGFAAWAFTLIGIALAAYAIVNPPHVTRLQVRLASPPGSNRPAAHRR
jgi:hypothetical protein